MKILFLTFYFEPDLCAGSFRNTPLVDILKNKITHGDEIEVVTTMPNRYKSLKNEALSIENNGNITICRIELPAHNSGMIDQVKSFNTFFWSVFKVIRNKDYDLVYASSSRLFTAVLGALIARKLNKPLYLDIRDIFIDTLDDVIKNKTFKVILLPILKAIERYTFNTATHINLVSEGFKDYFSKYKASKSYFSNGIDDAFLRDWPIDNSIKERRTILYAGNIGEGQGLEKIIPQSAEILHDKFDFVVVGDGGTKALLEKRIKEKGLRNVQLLTPVNRDKLIDLYINADYLFLHLNDYDAFKKVLPSKIFEYGATTKVLIAGVGGYAESFLNSEVENCIVFEPCNIEMFTNKILSFEYKQVKRETFIQKYTRAKIMDEMAQSILSLIKPN